MATKEDGPKPRSAALAREVNYFRRTFGYPRAEPASDPEEVAVACIQGDGRWPEPVAAVMYWCDLSEEDAQELYVTLKQHWFSPEIHDAVAKLRQKWAKNTPLQDGTMTEARARGATPKELVVRSLEDADRAMQKIEAAARRALDDIRAIAAGPLDILRMLKFEPVGRHPLEDRELNLIEQVNQTWTFAVAIAAAKELIRLHPDAGGFRLAPGAHASQPLDVMSLRADFVGAETFAAVHPRNNYKLRKDLEKLEKYPHTKHRYIFFMSPQHRGNARLKEFERNGIQVWSVDF